MSRLFFLNDDDKKKVNKPHKASGHDERKKTPSERNVNLVVVKRGGLPLYILFQKAACIVYVMNKSTGAKMMRTGVRANRYRAGLRQTGKKH